MDSTASFKQVQQYQTSIKDCALHLRELIPQYPQVNDFVSQLTQIQYGLGDFMVAQWPTLAEKVDRTAISDDVRVSTSNLGSKSDIPVAASAGATSRSGTQH